MSKKRLIITVLLLVVVVGGFMGYRMWNKPFEKVEDQQSVAVAAEALTDAFEKNEQSANATYLNKVIDVSGTVSEVSKNQDGKTVVLLQSSDPMSGVQCTMRDNNVVVTVGQQVSIKGFCNGYTLVVLLSDCIINQ